MHSGSLIKCLYFCAAQWLPGCEGGVCMEAPHRNGFWPHRPAFLSTQHHVCLVKLKPKCAAVCFPLVVRARPQKQIFNESRERRWNFPASVNLKQNQGNWHRSLSEAVMERRGLLPCATQVCFSLHFHRGQHEPELPALQPLMLLWLVKPPIWLP